MPPREADDLARNVHGVLGIPVDVVDIPLVLNRIHAAAISGTPLFLSTANLNFLISSRRDAAFRRSLLLSDLCTVDGMPVVWLARLLGVPDVKRTAGSDLFDMLKSASFDTPLRIFLFGGSEGAADAACTKLNASSCALTCVGTFYPGFGTVEEMSTDAIIDRVNASKADFLAVALGAKKGQAWLLCNHDRLRIPVRAHLGAVINFQADTVARAPLWMRKFGLEWLWRIKEEPHLWRRYGKDSIVLLTLLTARALPLLILAQWHKLRRIGKPLKLSVRLSESERSVTLHLSGAATASNVGKTVAYCREAIATAKDVVINCSRMYFIDTRFLGLLLMLNKQLTTRGNRLRFVEVSPSLRRLFHLNEFGYLLTTESGTVS